VIRAKFSFQPDRQWHEKQHYIKKKMYKSMIPKSARDDKRQNGRMIQFLVCRNISRLEGAKRRGIGEARQAKPLAVCCQKNAVMRIYTNGVSA
jgi:hypothetical protein